MRRGALGIVMVSALLFVGMNGAFAAPASHVTIAYNHMSMHFNGKVTSGNAECTAHRTVKIFKVTASGPKLLAKVQTGSMGRWSADLMHAAHGKYFAKVPKQKEMAVECLGARSTTIDVM